MVYHCVLLLTHLLHDCLLIKQKVSKPQVTTCRHLLTSPGGTTWCLQTVAAHWRLVWRSQAAAPSSTPSEAAPPATSQFRTSSTKGLRSCVQLRERCVLPKLCHKLPAACLSSSATNDAPGAAIASPVQNPELLSEVGRPASWQSLMLSCCRRLKSSAAASVAGSWRQKPGK